MSAQEACDRLVASLGLVGGQIMTQTAGEASVFVLCKGQRDVMLTHLDCATQLAASATALKSDFSFRFFRGEQTGKMTGGYRYLIEGPPEVLLAWGNALYAQLKQTLDAQAEVVDRKQVTKPNGMAYSYALARPSLIPAELAATRSGS